ncbi:CZB domain-containing protein (plasmid) [Caulobacter sp. ErkDOM-YI]|uniref:CZB domain-containing protein n=1 Tax=unclassified Caulobacter TaxID=2648921 RepID=UPI003AF52D1D
MSEFLDKAFMTHSAVKGRLRKAIKGEENIEPATIRRDDVCEVGKWIYGEGGKQFSSVPVFVEFKKVHAEFHKCAYDIMMLYNAGKIAEANRELDQGAFEKKSNEIGSCIMRMKQDSQFK